MLLLCNGWLASGHLANCSITQKENEHITTLARVSGRGAMVTVLSHTGRHCQYCTLQHCMSNWTPARCHLLKSSPVEQQGDHSPYFFLSPSLSLPLTLIVFLWEISLPQEHRYINSNRSGLVRYANGYNWKDFQMTISTHCWRTAFVRSRHSYIYNMAQTYSSKVTEKKTDHETARWDYKWI